jgi:hypothetical protein
MKKNLLGLIAILFISASAIAQSLSLGSDSLWVSGAANDSYIQAATRVYNISASSKDVRVKRYRVQTLGGTSTDYFCWSICHTPVVSEDPDFVTIAPSTFSDAFYGDFVPNGQTGDAIVLYTFFDHNNPSDSVQLKVVYNVTPTGISALEAKNNFQLFPNPANDVIRVKYAFDTNADLIIYDITGKIVRKETLFAGQSDFTLNIADLNSGVYFYSVSNGRELVGVKKLIKK